MSDTNRSDTSSSKRPWWSLKDHPIIVLLPYTILVSATTWAAFTYIFDTNRIQNYQSRIEVLQNEIDQLREENKKYLGWLQSSSGTIPYFEKKVSDLETALKTSTQSVTAKPATDTVGSGKQEWDTPLGINVEIRESESYISKDRSLIIGVNHIFADNTAEFTITYNGTKIVSSERMTVANAIPIRIAKNPIVVFISKINFVTSKVEIGIN